MPAWPALRSRERTSVSVIRQMHVLALFAVQDNTGTKRFSLPWRNGHTELNSCPCPGEKKSAPVSVGSCQCVFMCIIFNTTCCFPVTTPLSSPHPLPPTPRPTKEDSNLYRGVKCCCFVMSIRQGNDVTVY